jgi:hypothetical protein
VSSNNLDWTLWQTASAAPFGPFDNRFEVRFPTARTRYVKVVVVPLAATVVGALGFPDIFVTELQAILTLPAAQATQGSTQTTHTANVAAKARLLDNPSLFYDFSLFYTRNEQPSSVSRTPSDADPQLGVQRPQRIRRGPDQRAQLVVPEQPGHLVSGY